MEIGWESNKILKPLYESFLFPRWRLPDPAPSFFISKLVKSLFISILLKSFLFNIDHSISSSLIIEYTPLYIKNKRILPLLFFMLTFKPSIYQRAPLAIGGKSSLIRAFALLQYTLRCSHILHTARCFSVYRINYLQVDFNPLISL